MLTQTITALLLFTSKSAFVIKSFRITELSNSIFTANTLLARQGQGHGIGVCHIAGVIDLNHEVGGEDSETLIRFIQVRIANLVTVPSKSADTSIWISSFFSLTASLTEMSYFLVF